MFQPGESVGVEDVQAIEARMAAETPEPEDIDIEQWIGDQARDAERLGEVIIDGRRIKISVVSEGDENKLMKAARKPDPQNPREKKTDFLLYRRLYVAHSLSHAYGKTIFPDSLLNLPPGVVTKLQNEIQKLGKYELPERSQDPFSFLA